MVQVVILTYDSMIKENGHIIEIIKQVFEN